ncbi:MAG: recombinase family protein [Pseudomonadota bacterium]
MIIGYARVSTVDQNLDAQLDALKEAGAGRVFSETISGATAKRPELQRMLDQLRHGDVVVVTQYDRLARSLRDLLDIVEAIMEGGAVLLVRAGKRPLAVAKIVRNLVDDLGAADMGALTEEVTVADERRSTISVLTDHRHVLSRPLGYKKRN